MPLESTEASSARTASGDIPRGRGFEGDASASLGWSRMLDDDCRRTESDCELKSDDSGAKSETLRVSASVGPRRTRRRFRNPAIANGGQLRATRAPVLRLGVIWLVHASHHGAARIALHMNFPPADLSGVISHMPVCGQRGVVWCQRREIYS